jgi:hypothetical protein
MWAIDLSQKRYNASAALHCKRIIMTGSTRLRPMILAGRQRAVIASQDERGGRRIGRDVPSVMLFHARYSTPTAAVSRNVATKEPSTFWFEPCAPLRELKSVAPGNRRREDGPCR